MIAELDGEVDGAVAAAQRLRRGILDHAVVEGIERERLDTGERRAPFLAERDHELPADDLGAARRRRGTGQLGARPIKQLGRGRILRSPRRGHGKLQVKIRALGNAHVGAHEPACLRFEVEGRRGFQVGRGGDLDEMQGLLRVAVVHQRRDHEAVGCGPLDVARGEARRQAPRDLRGLSGIAGVAPVGVPAVADVELERDPERLAGCDRILLAQQPSPDIVGRDRVPAQRIDGRSEQG